MTGLVKINVQMTAAEAEAFAQFLKRVCYSDYNNRAANSNEAYIMSDAGNCIRQALADVGFSPR